MDFACSSGLRADYLHSIPDDPSLVFAQYEHLKRSFQNTDSECEAQGLTFTPMIVEAHSGAWSATAKQVWARISKAQSATWNEDGDVASVRIAQRLAFALHRENARAVLRRANPPEDVVTSTGWDVIMDDVNP